MKFTLLSITILSVVSKISNCQISGSYIEDNLLTAGSTDTAIDATPSINEVQLGTYLLHLPSTMKSTYTPYVSYKDQSATKENKTNTLKPTSTQSIFSSTSVVSKAANVTTTKINLHKRPLSSKITTSDFKTQASLGFANIKTIPCHTLLLLFISIFI
ncbi:hypothetical protein MOSE0_K08328 [Monosporozyma servazzii]